VTEFLTQQAEHVKTLKTWTLYAKTKKLNAITIAMASVQFRLAVDNVRSKAVKNSIAKITRRRNMIYEAKCPICGKINKLEVDDTAFMAYKAGVGKIQHLFPDLKPEERELIQTGICNTCWNDMFPEDEE
jgi:hypothetical protein